jgi:hypothetical protein
MVANNRPAVSLIRLLPELQSYYSIPFNSLSIHRLHKQNVDSLANHMISIPISSSKVLNNTTDVQQFSHLLHSTFNA